jgi:hypothetical protein
MKIAAVPILDSKDQRWAVKQVVEFYRRTGARIHLVNVQPRYSNYVARFFSARYLERIHREEGLRMLAPLMRALEKAGVPHKAHVLVGRKAERIAEFVESYPCNELLVRNESQSLLRLGFESVNSGIRRKLRTLYPEGKISLTGSR